MATGDQERGKGPAKPGAPAGEKKRIGELLVSEGIISNRQLQDALETQQRTGGKVAEILISQGAMNLQQFVRFLAHQPGVASIDLSHYRIPEDIVSLVPKDIAVAHEVFPIDKMGRLLTLGMACPLDSRTIGQIEEVTQLRVKALLCSPEDIRAAIKRYYPSDEKDFETMVIPGAARQKPAADKAETPAPAPSSESEVPAMEAEMKLASVAKLVQELDSLPGLPETVEKVRSAMSDLTISPKDVSETIMRDPPIAAKVLSVANSAAYGFPQKVDSVDLAVSLLGLRETYAIVLSAAVINLFDESKQFDYKTFWKEAMNCAAACRLIAKACGLSQRRSIFTAGLLHGIGRIALLEAAPKQYTTISSDLGGRELAKAEQDVLGITHMEAGYILALNWNLPVEIAEPIRCYLVDDAEPENPKDVAVVSIAESWTRHHAMQGKTKAEGIKDVADSLKLLGINDGMADQLYDEVTELEPVRFDWTKKQSG